MIQKQADIIATVTGQDDEPILHTRDSDAAMMLVTVLNNRHALLVACRKALEWGWVKTGALSLHYESVYDETVHQIILSALSRANKLDTMLTAYGRGLPAIRLKALDPGPYAG